jgi:hypothetical protein
MLAEKSVASGDRATGMIIAGEGRKAMKKESSHFCILIPENREANLIKCSH